MMAILECIQRGLDYATEASETDDREDELSSLRAADDELERAVVEIRERAKALEPLTASASY